MQVDEPVVTDSPAIWMTTYQMLEQLSLRRTIFPSVLENVTELSAEQRLQLLLTEEEWTVVDDIVAALGPFKVSIGLFHVVSSTFIMRSLHLIQNI